MKLAKKLPVKQWAKLKEEVEKEQTTDISDKEKMITFLMDAPTFNDKQIKKIAQTRKEMNEWRND